eukprot:2981897-Pyramimonas_sp.AAC.1
MGDDEGQRPVKVSETEAPMHAEEEVIPLNIPSPDEPVDAPWGGGSSSSGAASGAPSGSDVP